MLNYHREERERQAALFYGNVGSRRLTRVIVSSDVSNECTFCNGIITLVTPRIVGQLAIDGDHALAVCRLSIRFHAKRPKRAARRKREQSIARRWRSQASRERRDKSAIKYCVIWPTHSVSTSHLSGLTLAGAHRGSALLSPDGEAQRRRGRRVNTEDRKKRANRQMWNIVRLDGGNEMTLT